MNKEVNTNGRGCSPIADKKNGVKPNSLFMNAFLMLHKNIRLTLSDFSIILLALNPAIWSSCTVPDETQAECICELSDLYESKAEGGKDLHVFIFDDDSLKRLDSYQLCKGVSSINVSSRTGKKLLCAIWSENFDCSGIEGYEGLCGKHVHLMDDNPFEPVKRAEIRIEMGKQKSVRIEMEPIVSSVRLKRIRCDFSGKPYSNEIIRFPRIYLTNVSGQCGVMDRGNVNTEIILNNGEYNLNDDSECKGMLSLQVTGEIGKEWKNINGTMYCYPNTNRQESLGAPFTRLVVEGKIAGVRYWWPIDINRKDFGWSGGIEGIEANSSYEISLTIKRLGSNDPDTAVSSKDVELDFGIVPWRVEESTIEEY